MRQAIHNWQMDQRTGADPQPPQKPRYRSAFRILGFFADGHRRTIALVMICSVIAIAAELSQPYLLKRIIDDHLMAGMKDYGAILRIILLYFGLAVFAFIFTYLTNNLLQHAGQSIVARVRKRLFEHMTKLPLSYFDKTPSGSLITHISSDTEVLSQFFNQVLLTLFRDGFTLLFILFMMFQLDPTLGAWCLLLLPLIAGIAIAFRAYIRNTYQLARSRLSRLVAFTAENLSGMGIVQAFRQQTTQEQEFDSHNRDYFRANVREVRTMVLFNRSFELLSNVTIATIMWLGGRAVLHSDLELGVLVAFITYIRQFFQPINAITMQWNTLQSATVSANRIWNVLQTEPEIREYPEYVPASSPENSKVEGRIDFNRVTFGYDPETPVIKGIDLHVRPGEMIGIVGETGAGKSSLVSLLCRFYDVQEGSIRIDGTDIRDIPRQKLQRMVGLIQQEPFLYAGSVIDNVRLFDESIPREEVIRACRFVGADPLIRRMEDGYDTKLSERGSGLSTGERQLLSFARILVFQPPILILDEATANLDSRTEQLLQNALQTVSRGRTTLVIAHRLSTIVQADRIIVMRNGEIVEEGKHGELLAMKGYYEQLYRHSLGGRAEQAIGS
jgi:ATP-binding cassette subfamily B protein